MGSGVCTNALEVCEFPYRKSVEKLDKASVFGIQKGAAEPPVGLKADGTASLGPITPIADRENGDFLIDFSSPPSMLKKPSNGTCFISNANGNGDDAFGYAHDSSSPRTPVDGVFDPFASGRDDLALAPRCNKYVSKSRSVVARQLKFDSPVQSSEDEVWTDVESISDEEMFEAVYENLLEAIVSEQTEGVLAKLSRKESDSDDCITPPPQPRLKGDADSCPGAPMRPSGKSRNIDLGLIRKLEF